MLGHAAARAHRRAAGSERKDDADRLGRELGLGDPGLQGEKCGQNARKRVGHPTEHNLYPPQFDFFVSDNLHHGGGSAKVKFLRL